MFFPEVSSVLLLDRSGNDMLCSILFLSLGFDVLTDHFYWCPSCRQKAETLAPECFFPKFFPDFRILFFQQPAAGTFISIDKFTEFCFRLCTKHYMHMINIMIPFLQNNSIPWILSSKKCSFLFFAIHLPPVEEGEFLLTFVKIRVAGFSLPQNKPAHNFYPQDP